ncbi:MAG TPA: hypothetical protein PK098_05650 [Phycisphaerales bacterium]|nr:hypothetical protein [Phycisphaerales bacterium]
MMTSSPSSPLHTLGRIASLWLVRLLAGVVIAGLAFNAALLIVYFLFEPHSAWFRHFFSAMFITTLFAGLILCASIIMHQRRMAPLMLLSIFVAAGAAMLWWPVLWDSLRSSQQMLYARLAGMLTIFAIACVHSGFLAVVPSRGGTGLGLKLVLAAVAWTTSVVAMATLFDDIMVSNVMGALAMNILIFGSVFTALGTIFVPVVLLTMKRRENARRESLGERIEVELCCPKCSTEQVTRTGPTRCIACGTLMNIELEEPRCDCGYSLFRLRADTCPECGTVIPEEKKWTEQAATQKPAFMAHPQPIEATA